MDMNFPTPLSPPEALRRLLDQVMAGGDAVVDGPGASMVLDQAAALLAVRRSRVLRAGAAGPGGLGLQELMDQVAGCQDPGGPGGASLEQGAQALTAPDAGCDRIVLMLDDAEAVQPAALRYLQLACRTGAKLRLVLVGMPDGLDGAEFASLRARLQARPVLALDGSLPGAVPGPAARDTAPAAVVRDQAAPARHLTAPPSGRPQVAAMAAPRWMRPATAALGIAACAALGVFAAGRAPERSGASAALPAATEPAAPPPDAAVALAGPPTAAETEAPAAPAITSSGPGLAAVQPVPEPPPATARPPGRRGTASRPAETRLRDPSPRNAHRSLVRLPRSYAAHPYGTWGEPRADAWDGGREASRGWTGGWQPDARPYPPGAYPGGPYAGGAYPEELWRRADPWWPR